MKRHLERALALALCGVATNAHAQFACQANPAEFLGIDVGGSVLVSVNGAGRVKVCNVGIEQGGIPATTCTAWYSSFVTARMARTTLTVYFDESNPLNAGANACTNLGEWNVRVPYYIEFHP